MMDIFDQSFVHIAIVTYRYIYPVISSNNTKCSNPLRVSDKGVCPSLKTFICFKNQLI